MAAFNFVGNAAANSITPPQGRNPYIIDGGGGIDTLYIPLSQASFTITGPDASGVTTLSGASGTQLQLTNVEKIYFINTLYNVPAAPADTTAPTVAAFSPAGAATNVAIASNIVVTFSEAIQRGTGSIVLTDAAGTVIEAFDAATSPLLTIAGTTVTINPTSDLAYSANYFVTFASGTIKDLAGNAYAGHTNYSFTTTAPPDAIAPTISLFSPASAATDVALASNIVAIFSEAVQRGTGSIILTDAAGAVIETFDAATSPLLTVSGSTLTINPTSDLAYSTNYLVTFAAGAIKDLAGNAYAGTATYNFTTLADTIAPTVLSFSPTASDIGVAVGADITTVFSENIARGTGNIVLKNAAGTTIETFDAAASPLLTISGATLTINPTSDLANSTNYFVTFASGAITDVAGNAYAGISTYNFTTIAATTTGNDTLTGSAGSDILTGGAGNDILSGGAGIDSSTYSAARSSYTITATTTGYTISGGTDGSDTLTDVERLVFTDQNVALDLAGNAGTTAKILGAVFGAASVSNSTYAGIGLNYLDGGMSYADLMALALGAAGATTSNATVTLLWTNLFGVAPTAAEAAPYVAMLDSGSFTAGALGVLAADTSFNTTNINLVGLAQTGIAYI